MSCRALLRHVLFSKIALEPRANVVELGRCIFTKWGIGWRAQQLKGRAKWQTVVGMLVSAVSSESERHLHGHYFGGHLSASIRSLSHLPRTPSLFLSSISLSRSLSVYVCIYIYIWQLGHLLPTFAQKCHFFPSFIAKMAQKNLSIYGQIFAFFWILSKCTFNQFLEDIRM